jgi:alkylation response protein AidB-like acyl-CoA dehydrogenase
LDIVKLAQDLATEFRERAAEYDRTGEFPVKHYDRMREASYLRALVPQELGGLGAGLAEMARAQQQLARGCASTALAVNMHQFQVGVAADGWRKGAPVEGTLRRIAQEGIVLGSTGAEAIVADAWTTSTTAVRENGGYRVNGRKFFCSQAPGMDVVRVNALDTETGEILVLAVPAHLDGVKVVETWDTAGMRATASHDLVLENVLVPEAAVGARLPASAPVRGAPFANVIRWFLPLVSSVYLGVAEEARSEAYRALGGSVNSEFRAQPLTDLMIGEMEAALLTGVSVRDAIAGQLEQPDLDPQHAVALAAMCRHVVIERAIETVEKATAIAGGRAFFRKSPLERLNRDIRAGRFHPPAAPVALQMVGERFRQARIAQP